MTRPLTVHNAQITTAAVEVKTLTISGKQVTLAVFRQLREEPLIAEDGALNGVPWGTVNYHPDKCGGDNWPEHTHVVWQRGADLLRAHIAKIPEFDRNERAFSPGSGDAFYDACVRAALCGNPCTGYFKGEPLVRDEGRADPYQNRWVKVRGIRSLMRLSPETFRVAQLASQLLRSRESAVQEQEWYPDADGTEKSYKTNHRRRLPAAEAEAGEAIARLGEQGISAASIDALYGTYDAEMEAEAGRRQRHRDQRAAIADLPQLFIAV